MTCVLFSHWYHSLQKWLGILCLLLLMLNLSKIHHHSAEISFLTMSFPFWLSLWLSWVIPNHSPYLFVQVFLPSYWSFSRMRFFCINLFCVLPDCNLYFIFKPCQLPSHCVLSCQQGDYISSRTIILYFGKFSVLFSAPVQCFLPKKQKCFYAWRCCFFTQNVWMVQVHFILSKIKIYDYELFNILIFQIYKLSP